jgi:hypothetical protein
MSCEVVLPSNNSIAEWLRDGSGSAERSED